MYAALLIVSPLFSKEALSIYSIACVLICLRYGNCFAGKTMAFSFSWPYKRSLKESISVTLVTPLPHSFPNPMLWNFDVHKVRSLKVLMWRTIILFKVGFKGISYRFHVMIGRRILLFMPYTPQSGKKAINLPRFPVLHRKPWVIQTPF